MPGAEQPTAWTLYFATDDMDRSLATARELGGSTVFGPMDIPGTGVQAVVADPTGAVFGLWQPRPFPGSGAWLEPGAPAWAEVNTRDAARARDFYVGLLGLAAHAVPGGMAYHTLHHGDAAVAGVLQMTEQWPADLPAHWMVYFAVADVDAAVATVERLGGEQVVPAFDTTYGRISVVMDPQGGVFTLIRLAGR